MREGEEGLGHAAGSACLHACRRVHSGRGPRPPVADPGGGGVALPRLPTPAGLGRLAVAQAASGSAATTGGPASPPDPAHVRAF